MYKRACETKGGGGGKTWTVRYRFLSLSFSMSLSLSVFFLISLDPGGKDEFVGLIYLPLQQTRDGPMTSRRLIFCSVLMVLGGLYSCHFVPPVYGQGFPPDGCSFELEIDGQCCFCFIGTKMIDRGVNKTNHCCDCEVR